MTATPETLVTPIQGDREAADNFFASWPRVTVPDYFRAALAEALRGHRLAALEEAAKVCEQQATDFLDPQYATPQPVGSITERFACKECADAIRKLIGDSK